MSKDVDCPYCGHPQDINHDDGYGYEEVVLHQQVWGMWKNVCVPNRGELLLYSV